MQLEKIEKIVIHRLGKNEDNDRIVEGFGIVISQSPSEERDVCRNRKKKTLGHTFLSLTSGESVRTLKGRGVHGDQIVDAFMKWLLQTYSIAFWIFAYTTRY